MALKGDFIGFTFNGSHSSDKGIIRTSNGSRFNESLLPTSQDKTVVVPGADGTYFFGSNYVQKPFSISIATDELTEKQLRELKQWVGDKGIHELIFDETPYKKYMVKCTGNPQFNFICFDKQFGERIYKGEGSLQFTAYFPYAKSIYKWLDQYNEEVYKNKDEWSITSGMKESQERYDLPGREISVYNPGDVETDFKIYFSFTNGKIELGTISLKNLDGVVTDIIKTKTIEKIGEDGFICFNSKTNLVEGCIKQGEDFVITGNLYNSFITSGDFFKIPIGEYKINCGLACEKIEYDYLYF